MFYYFFIYIINLKGELQIHLANDEAVLRNEFGIKYSLLNTNMSSDLAQILFEAHNSKSI